MDASTAAAFCVGLAADKYDTEEDLAEELKLPDPYVAVRMNRLS